MLSQIQTASKNLAATELPRSSLNPELQPLWDVMRMHKKTFGGAPDDDYWLAWLRGARNFNR